MASYYRVLSSSDESPSCYSGRCSAPSLPPAASPSPLLTSIPSPTPNSSSSSPSSSKGTNLTVPALVLASVLATFFLFLTYYTVLLRHRSSLRRRRRRRTWPDSSPPSDNGGEDFRFPEDGHHVWYIRTVGLEEAIIDSIAVVPYKGGDGVVEGTDCSVCLSEFAEGELVRLLPKCSHAFHIQCIDTWLRSHVNCPLCRAPVVDPPPLASAAPGGDLGQPESSAGAVLPDGNGYGNSNASPNPGESSFRVLVMPVTPSALQKDGISDGGIAESGIGASIVVGPSSSALDPGFQVLSDVGGDGGGSHSSGNYSLATVDVELGGGLLIFQRSASMGSSGTESHCLKVDSGGSSCEDRKESATMQREKEENEHKGSSSPKSTSEMETSLSSSGGSFFSRLRVGRSNSIIPL